MTSPSVIEVRNFSMALGGKQIVDDLSFEVGRGETFGLLGSNGSGKTTTLRALLGIYTPTSGELLVNGAPFNPATSGPLGYLPEERGLYRKEKVIDVMTYFGQLKGMTRTAAALWSMGFLRRVGLEDHARVRLDKLSGDSSRRCRSASRS